MSQPGETPKPMRDRGLQSLASLDGTELSSSRELTRSGSGEREHP